MIIVSDHIRTFSKDINENLLVWHRDKEDRTISVIQGTGWKLQLEDKLPVELKENKSYFIPKETYHRVIKNNNDLKIQIKEK